MTGPMLAASALAAPLAPEFEDALADGRLARARFLATEALRADPADADRWFALARVTDDPEEAESLLSEALRQRPADPTIVIARARALASLGETREAAAELRRLPDGPQVWVALADLERDPGPARRALALAPGDPAAALALARYTDDPGEARVALAAVWVPDRAVCVARVEQALRDADPVAARTAWAELAAVAPSGPDTVHLARWVECIERHPDTPVGAFLDARRQAMVEPLHPPDTIALVGQARGCAEAHVVVAEVATTPQARIDAWTRAAALAPDDPDVLLALGRELLDADRPAEARQYLERAQRDEDPPTELARALLALGEDDAARTLLDTAARRFPDDPDVVLARADAEPARRRALELLVEALERTSDARIEARARELAEALETEAFADVPRVPRHASPFEDDVSEEIVVVWKDSEDRLAEIVGKLRTLGYRGDVERRRDGVVHVDAEGMDRPAVTLHPDGEFEIQRAGLVPVEKTPWLEHSRTTLQAVSERKLRSGRERVMTALQPELLAWRAALRTEGLE